MEQGETPPAKSAVLPKMSERLRRFDEVFRPLLIIVTIISGSIAFSKGLLPTDVFASMIGLLAATIITWSVGTLLGRDTEIVFKILAWDFLMLTLFWDFWHFTNYSAYIMPTGTITLISVGAFLFSLPILIYLEELVPPKMRKSLFFVIFGLMILFIVADGISARAIR